MNSQSPSSLNATRHGCCALETLILPSESIEDFHALETAWRNTYQPQDETTTNLVDQLVTAEWLYRRSVRTLTDIQAQIFAAEPNPLNWTDAHHKAITRFERYRTANQNAFARARKAVEDLRRNRATESQREERSQIAKVRLKVYQEKNKPKPTLEETIDMMRRKAIELGYHPPKE
jgi:hypothetical protein